MGWWDWLLNRPTRAEFLSHVRARLTAHGSTRSLKVDEARCTLTLDLDKNPRLLELDEDYREYCRTSASLRSRWLAELTEMIHGELGTAGPDEPVVTQAEWDEPEGPPDDAPHPIQADAVRVNWGWADLNAQERQIARRTQAWIMALEPRPLAVVVDRLTDASRELPSRKLIARFTGTTPEGRVEVRMRLRNGVRSTRSRLVEGGVFLELPWDDREVEQHLDRADFEATGIPSLPLAVRWPGVQLEDLAPLNTGGEPLSLLLQRVWEVEGLAICQAPSIGTFGPPHPEAAKPLHLYFRVGNATAREISLAAETFGCTADEVALAAVFSALGKLPARAG